MKASEIRPCDHCGGKLGLSFVAVDVSQVLVDVRPLQERQGLMLMWGGDPRMLPMADVFASRSLDEVAVRLADEDPKLGTRLILCYMCEAELGLASLVQKVIDRNEAAQAAAGGQEEPEEETE
jgi:hypothetical protein